MESKKKFNKNRYWKSKYRPRNASTSTTVKKPELKKNENSDGSEESEEEFVLKQRLPENGWFPEYDSSSSSDLEFLTTVTNSASTSEVRKDITKSNDKWFNKELDSLQFNPNVPDTTQYKTIKENENKLKLSSSDVDNSEFKLNKNTINTTPVTLDKEEDIEFLLSLTEPVHTRPLLSQNNLENERRLMVTNNVIDKPVKSIDLEKWLDSVLDD